MVQLAFLRILVVALALLFTTGASAHPPYKRAEWRHWIDEDGDCQKTRAEVLIRDARPGTVTFEDERQCEVASGEWVDPYTGEAFTNPGDLQIDHLVPLKNAHDSGGWRWSRERKEAYANELSYLYHLLAVKGSENQRKGDKGPDKWRPPRREFWCQYAQAWASVEATWGLTVRERERQALREMLAMC